jgi:hypothetical protein
MSPSRELLVRWLGFVVFAMSGVAKRSRRGHRIRDGDAFASAGLRQLQEIISVERARKNIA